MVRTLFAMKYHTKKYPEIEPFGFFYELVNRHGPFKFSLRSLIAENEVFVNVGPREASKISSDYRYPGQNMVPKPQEKVEEDEWAS